MRITRKPYEASIDIGDQTASLGYDPEVAEGKLSLVLAEVQWLRLRDIPERDRALLWASGLVGAGDFLREIEGWGDCKSYPGSQEIE